MQNQTINGVSSVAVTPQINLQSIIQRTVETMDKDLKTVQSLKQLGIITNEECQYLLGKMKEKAQTLGLFNTVMPENPQQSIQPPVQVNPFDLFNQEKPGFFEQGGRNAVLNYLKGLDVDKDEISKIAELVENLENSAIDGYLKKSAHDKSLNDENLTAKSKLTSYTQGASSAGDIGRIFTREDIGNMSGEEFAKNEKLIMEQVRQGLIK